MSQTFSLVCHETRQALWVGQGREGVMTSLYGSGEHLERLADFLRQTSGKPLVLLCDDIQGQQHEEYERLDPP